MAYQLKAHILICAQITCLTGLHIGGSEERCAVGSADHPVIRDGASGNPYIPGSSLKGKLRSLLEWTFGKIDEDGRAHGRSCRDADCAVCRMFGAAWDDGEPERPRRGPTRVLVRDAFLSADTLARVQEGRAFPTEQKAEIRLNRITAESTVRLVERVPKGAQFDFEVLYGIYDLGDGGQTDIDNLTHLYTAFALLEAGALGGGSSRGAGRIALERVRATIKSVSEYQAQAAGHVVDWPTITGRCAAELAAAVRDALGLPPGAGASAS